MPVCLSTDVVFYLKAVLSLVLLLFPSLLEFWNPSVNKAFENSAIATISSIHQVSCPFNCN